jgi:hypothetical protein
MVSSSRDTPRHDPREPRAGPTRRDGDHPVGVVDEPLARLGGTGIKRVPIDEDAPERSLAAAEGPMASGEAVGRDSRRPKTGALRRFAT